MKQRHRALLMSGLVSFLLPAWAERQFNPNQVIVQQDSKVVREAYAQPVTSDLFALLVVRETLRFADDQKAVTALDEYLARAGLLALAGETFSQRGTIEGIVTGASALPRVPGDLVSRILSTTLTPRLAVSVNTERQLPNPESSVQTHKQEYPGVWSSGHQAGSAWVEVFVLVENTGRNRITEFETGLQIDREADKPIELKCRASPWFNSIAPGENRLHVCSADVERVAIADLVKAVRAAERTPSRWRLVPNRINFVDPAVNFGNRGVYYWLDTGRAWQQATIALQAAGCEARGSCWEDFQTKLKQNPQFILIAGGGLAGIVLGWLIARRVRRPVIAGLVVTLLPVGGVVAAIVVILMTAKGQEALAVLAVAYFGFLALTPFLVALWITIAIVRGRRAKPAS